MKTVGFILILFFGTTFARDAESDRPQLPVALRGVGVDQNLNAQIPLDATFHDDTGRSVQLAEYFGRKPVILAMVYYECPMLCTQILNGLISALKPVSFRAGGQFDVLSVSINPAEVPALAAKKKQSYVGRYSRTANPDGFHFLTGEEPSIRRLADAVGFHYSYDPKTKLFAHASAVMILTPQGRVSRYYYGVEYSPRDLRLGLVEASQNKIGTPVDQLLLFCYHYDPADGKYSAMALNMIRIGGVLFMLILGTYLVIMWRLEAARGRRLKEAL
jgi:protein SCO1